MLSKSIPSVRLTRSMKSRICNSLSKIIPSEYDNEISILTEVIIDGLAVEINELFPSAEMEILKKYNVTDFVYGISREISNISRNIRIKNIKKNLDNNKFYCSDDRIILDKPLKFNRWIFGSTPDKKLKINSSEVLIDEQYLPIFASNLSDDIKEYVLLIEKKGQQLNEVIQAYKHIIETTTTLSKLYESLPEIKDGVISLFSKTVCVGSNEDDLLKRIIRYREKNNIKV